MEWLRWILLAIGALLIGGIYVSGRLRRRADSRDAADGIDEAPRSGADFAPFDETSSDPGADTGDWARDEWARDEWVRDEWVPDEWVPDEWVPPEIDLPTQRTPISDPVVPDEGTGAARDNGNARPAAPDPKPSPGPEPPPAREAPPPEPDHLVVLYVVAPEGERLVGASLAAAFARYGLEHGDLGAFHARARGGTELAGPGQNGATEFGVANMVEPGSFDPATMDTLSTPGVVLFLRLPGPPSPAAAFERMLATAHALAEELGARVLDERRAPLSRQAEQHLRDGLHRFVPAPERHRR